MPFVDTNNLVSHFTKQKHILTMSQDPQDIQWHYYSLIYMMMHIMP